MSEAGDGRTKGGLSLVQERDHPVWPRKAVPEEGSQGLGRRPPTSELLPRRHSGDEWAERPGWREGCFLECGREQCGGRRRACCELGQGEDRHLPGPSLALHSHAAHSQAASLRPGPKGRWEGTDGKGLISWPHSCGLGSGLWRLAPQVLASWERLHPGLGAGLSHTSTCLRPLPRSRLLGVSLAEQPVSHLATAPLAQGSMSLMGVVTLSRVPEPSGPQDRKKLRSWGLPGASQSLEGTRQVLGFPWCDWGLSSGRSQDWKPRGRRRPGHTGG